MISLTCDDVRDLAPAYVLGALERAEELAVTEHLLDCPNVHAEVAELGGVVPYLAETVPLVEPPASLRGRILIAAADDLAARRSRPADSLTEADTLTAAEFEEQQAATDAALDAAAIAATASAGVPPTELPPIGPLGRSGVGPIRPSGGPSTTGTVVSFDAARARRRDLRTWALGIAAAFAIVALGAWGVATQQDLNAARTYQARLTAALVQAGQPGSQVAVLASTGAPGAGPGGIAVLPASGNGTLLVSGLAPTSGSQVYEAWAIADGQPPTPVAGFTVGPDGIGYLDRMPPATGQTVTVAITLEPKPNPTAPSSAPLAAGVAVPAGAPG
jgi:hypothetical protein